MVQRSEDFGFAFKPGQSIRIVRKRLGQDLQRHLAGDGAPEDVVKIRLWDKPGSLRDLMKHLGLLVERVDVKFDVEITRRLKAGREFNRLAEERDAITVTSADVTAEKGA